MAGTVENKIAELGITLPTPAAPIATYVGFVRSGSLMFVSGQLCLEGGRLVATGQLGGSAINLVAQVKAALGDLDRVARVVRLNGFINSAPGFADAPKVMNGASDLIVELFGDKGRHTRTTVGVAALPNDAAVEIDGVFEVS